MTLKSNISTVAAFSILIPALLGGVPPAAAQGSQESGPAAALSAALTAACRADQAHFANYLTPENASAFHALPEDQRTAFLARFSLTNEAGKTLVSTDARNHTVLRCEAPQVTVEFRFGDARTSENLAFVPVTVANSEQTEFGLVRESGGWRLLSLGLVLLDIPQLSKQWAQGREASQEDAALATLSDLKDAVETYRRAFGKLPQSLAQLGPAPRDEISPEQASLVDEHLAAGGGDGYHFRYRIVPAADENDEKFEVAATPDNYGKTGRRSFFLDTSGKVHGADRQGSPAAPDDPLIEGEKTP
jgi:type II secretory pathway pseudopilin PulG